MADEFSTVDEYIASFPDDVRPVLQEIRRTVHAVVPGAEETISYKIPAITLGGRHLVYFAGWKRHVSVYPLPSGDTEFERRLAAYRSGTGTAKFPLGEPIPYDLIGQLVGLLVEQRTGGDK
ncbi:iron chaperone [Rhodococcus kronopolitis]|uniref:Iron chaperone n=1 Tax=Rhodococcus kronopolitis TaxID=1460226 RepID=A0ABV9FYD5_9NOCA